MKRVSILTVIVSLSIPLLGGSVRGEDSLRRYRVESGIVELSLTGVQVGTETIYFDKWGMREAKYTKSEITRDGVTRKIDRLILLNGEWMYNIDLIKRTGKRMPGSIMTEALERSGAKDLVDVVEASMKEMGGVKTGTEEVAGRTCDVWKIEKMNATNWVWDGLSRTL